MLPRMRGIVVAACVCLSCPSGADADAPRATLSDAARAQRHFDAGRALFELGNYPDAVREWKAGYSLTQRPGFLLNIGHALRQLNDLKGALESYRSYLTQVPADHPSRDPVLRIIDDVERALASAPPPPDPTPPPEPPAPPAGTIAVAVRSPASGEDMARRRRRIAWIAGGVTIGTVLVVGVVVGGVLGAQASRDWCGAGSIGCITAK